jgi:uncharacterized membrane protein YqjE
VASRPNSYPQEKPLAQILSEFKHELMEFASTRVSMLQSEMREKLVIAGTALQALVAGAILAAFAMFLLAIALVALIAMALGGGAGAWAAAFAIGGLAFLLVGGSAIAFGIWRLRARTLKPERTLHVLKQDQIWLQNETRNHR